MNIIEKFTLELLPTKEGEPEKSKLFYEDEETGVTLDGFVLDAQYAHKDKYVLFVTYDSPFAEHLHIYLLDGRFQKIDEWQIGQYWGQAVEHVHNLQIVSDNKLQFSFFNDELWLLTVAEEPQFVLPKLPLFSLSWKPLRFKFAPGYLQLQTLKH